MSTAAEYEALTPSIHFFPGPGTRTRRLLLRILPLTALGETLILQYLNNVPLDYDTLSLASPTAQSLAAAIRALDPNRVE